MAKRKKQELVTAAPINETTALIHVIARAAADPTVDVSKMEKLLDMQERVMEKQAKMDFTSALAQMQPLLPVVGERGGIKNARGQVQSTYALWEDINEGIRPFLAQFGFALTFRCGTDSDLITVTGVLSHKSGHSESTTIRLPVDTSGSKNAVQAVGSSTAYGKRYTAIALLNITSRGEDDDGLAGGAGPTITQEQVDEIRGLLNSTKSDPSAFLNYLEKQGKTRIPTVTDIPAVMYKDAIVALQRKVKKVAA